MTKQSIILGIESSCDETCCAIINQNGDILANIIASQASIHAPNGGVVPEVAARERHKARDNRSFETVRAYARKN